MNRREFLNRSAIAGLAASVAGGPLSFAQSRSPNRKMTLNLVCGAIGVKADQRRAIDLAHEYGFESVAAEARFLAQLKGDELKELGQGMRQKRIEWGSSSLTVQFRKSQEQFDAGMKELPQIAEGLRRAGVKRVSTWLMPCHDELTYRRNFEQHANRLRAVCEVLKENELMLGMEYVGTTSLMISQKHPFVQSMAEVLELADAIGTGNAGVVLDSWHWWQAGDTVADIERLNSEQIALVDLNDAPLGIEKDLQKDGRRELPMATGVIDLKGFMNALVKIGYDGPVRAEPFNQPLRKLDDGPACQATIDSLKKAFALIG